MVAIRPLVEADLPAFTLIVANAYPGMKLNAAEERQRWSERVWQAQQDSPTLKLYGAFQGDTLVGGMRLSDFRANILGQRLAVGGVGLVAVDLLHKKEYVAKHLIEYFIDHYHRRGTALTMLYPFRPDFYKQMGFGYGTKLCQYRVAPAAFPRASKAHLRPLTAADAARLHACYSREVERTHGMFERPLRAFERMFDEQALRVIGYEEAGELRGYLTFTFQPARSDNWLSNDLVIQELIYETPAALTEIATYLHTQADQINRVIVNTHDDTLHHLLRDPRNDSGNLVHVYHESNTQGVGLMYRIIDVPRLFAQLSAHRFSAESLVLELVVNDSFFPTNNRRTLVRFTHGVAEVQKGSVPDVTMTLDVAEFSSMIMGAVTCTDLYRYGLVTMSNDNSVTIWSLDSCIRIGKQQRRKVSHHR
jgi:predicted acetyltransferase